MISHGRVIECGPVTLLPEADHADWGSPLCQCDGLCLIEKYGYAQQAELLRIA